MLQHFQNLYHWLDVQCHRVPTIPRNLGVTALFLCAAYWASGLLIGHTGGENNSALVFVLAVAMISLLTSGYFYGIAASIIGTLCINIYFMEPYASFSSAAPATRWLCCPWWPSPAWCAPSPPG